MINVKKLTELFAIQNHEDGEYATVEEEQKVYKYSASTNSWEPFASDGQLTMNLFELNKTAIPQLPNLTLDDMMESKKIFTDYINSTNKKYYMLLSNSFKYYTLFVREPQATEEIEMAVISCLQGDIKSIELTGDGGAIEIWCVIDGIPYEFYFFNYEEGVIVCK